MQAIIMAAGKGSRLGSLTEELPKSFLEIKGKKIIEYTIDMLHHFGIWDIIIVIGYRDNDFRELFKNSPGITLVYNPFYEMTNVIGSFYMGMSHLHDDFVYLHADTLCDLGIFEDMLASEGDMVLPIDVGPCDDEAMKVRIEEGTIVEITKEMNSNVAEGEFIGIMKIKKNAIDSLTNATTELMRNKVFSSYFEGAIQNVIDINLFDIRAVETKERFWGEVDFMEDYKKACENISSNLMDL